MRTRVLVWLSVWAGSTALALFLAVSSSLTYISTGRPGSWWLTISRSLSEWWLWALLAPLIVGLARRFPLDAPGRTRSVAVHAVVGSAIALAKTAADRAIFAWISGFWLYFLASTVALQFCVYAVIVASAHLARYYQRSRERDQLEARLAEVRLQLLNLQLQPHFLFNTLNTIAELVHDEPDTADAMISELGTLLRRTLDLGHSPEVALTAELELLSLYLALQRARFGDRLQPVITIEPDTGDARVPPLLLQPIVENAIRHGLDRHVSAGRLEIEAHRENGMLAISVTDDGPGMADDPPREGIGLGNTRARLEALYPGASMLTLENVSGRGARVSVRLPFRTGLQPHDASHVDRG